MKKNLPKIGLFLAGALALFAVQKVATSLAEWRTIQVLQTSDRKHTAELKRLYGYIDVNFKILVDGNRVYWSPDFAPREDQTFREWIGWDEKQENLVFVVSDQILFAYNLRSGQPVPQKELSSLVIHPSSFSELGYEGDFKGEKLNGRLTQ